MQSLVPHQPVMLKEVIETLSPTNGATYIDATFGAGGYSRAILNAANCNVIGIDRDYHVKQYADNLSDQYSGRFTFINQAFGDLKNIATHHNINQVDGIVFDIGVSSMQLDEKERGFSFSKSAPLDMRMDNTIGITAKDIINNYSETKLADIIFNLGGERKSRKIAYLICKARSTSPIETTTALAEIIERGVGRKYNDTIHPATRTFQALRIMVNDELSQLAEGLIAASNLVAGNGKILVVTFHSLEDKIVKDFFNKLCGKKVNINRHLPQSTEQEEAKFEFLFKKAMLPSEAEVKANPRARSAKLRAIRKII